MEFNDFVKTKYEGYFINAKGDVFSIYKNKIISQTISKKGYLRVSIKINGKWNTYITHRLLAETFIPNPNNLPQVNHKNGIKKDNSLENLEWISCKDNIRHAINNGLFNNNSAHESLKKKIIDSNTKHIYESINYASKIVGIKPKTLSAMLNGQNPNKTTLNYL